MFGGGADAVRAGARAMAACAALRMTDAGRPAVKG